MAVKARLFALGVASLSSAVVCHEAVAEGVRALPFQPQVPQPSLIDAHKRLPYEPLPAVMPIARYLAATDSRPRHGDLDEMQRHRRLRVLMLREQAGELGSRDIAVERDLITGFARGTGMVPEWIWVDSPHELVPALANGRGDLVVGDVPVDSDKAIGIDRTVALKQVRYLVVTRATDRSIDSKTDLLGKRAGLSGNSPAWLLLERLSAGHAPVTRVATDGLSQQEVFARLRAGEFDFTVIESESDDPSADDLVGLRKATELTGSRSLSWLVRAGSPRLRDALNHHLNKTRLALRLHQPSRDDLGRINERGALRVITRQNAEDFFIYKGERAGFEYDMIREFCLRNGLRLEVIVADSDDQMLAWLKDGVGDVVTARIDRSAESDDNLEFTRMYRYTAPVLVGRVGQSAGQSQRARVLLPANSPFDALLRNSGVPLQVVRVAAGADILQMVDAVGDGHAEFTVVDADALPKVQRYRNDIQPLQSLAEPRPYRFTLRVDAPALREALDGFLQQEFGSDFYVAAERRYFDHDNLYAFRPRPRDNISPFDDLAKQYAERYSFDWRLIVAQMYEESRFKPRAVSEAGARGLMQVLPMTARSMGFRKLDRPEQGIHAGVKYLDVQRDRFEDTIAVADRTWFALAAYHAGFDRVQAARRHASRMGLDANRWFGNVDKAMVALSRNSRGNAYRGGRITVQYVRSVRERYETYLQMHPATTIAAL